MEIKKLRRRVKTTDLLLRLLNEEQINITYPLDANMDEVLTTKELCRRYLLEPRAVYDLIESGELEAKKSNGWRISVWSMNAYLFRIANDLPF